MTHAAHMAGQANTRKLLTRPWFLAMAALLAVFTLAASCAPAHAFWGADQDEKDTKAVLTQQGQYSKNQPVPTFDFSVERDLVIQLYKLRNAKVATHSVWRSNTGIIEGDCQSFGMPIPYDSSLTNPVRPHGTAYGVTTVEQPEPNGIYASKNTSATWVMCVVGAEVVPIYIESKVTAYPLAVEIDYTTNRVTFGNAKPTVTIKTK